MTVIMTRFLLGACMLRENEVAPSFRDAKAIGPLCAPLIYLARATVGGAMIERERELGRALTPAERDEKLQWVGDATLGHNTPFQSVWNLRDLSTRLSEVLPGQLSWTPGGDLVCGTDTVTLNSLR